MNDEKRGIKKFFVLFMIFLALHSIPTTLFGKEPGIRPENISESHGKYVLKIKGDFISLKANDASLKDILDEIGRRMRIEVVANIPVEEKITIKFDMMYLEDALKRFKTNYAYITKSVKEKGKIIRIVAVPSGNGKMLPDKFEYNPQPPIKNSVHESQPTTEEYNPQPPIKDFESKPQSTVVRSESKSQPSSSLNENNSQTPDVGIKYRSQTADVGSENNSQNSNAASESNSQPPDIESEYNPQPSIIEKQ